MSNNLECFNNILRDFVKELTSIFPKYVDILTENYKELLATGENSLSNNEYVKEYILKEIFAFLLDSFRYRLSKGLKSWINDSRKCH